MAIVGEVRVELFRIEHLSLVSCSKRIKRIITMALIVRHLHLKYVHEYVVFHYHIIRVLQAHQIWTLTVNVVPSLKVMKHFSYSFYLNSN